MRISSGPTPSRFPACTLKVGGPYQRPGANLHGVYMSPLSGKAAERAGNKSTGLPAPGTDPRVTCPHYLYNVSGIVWPQKALVEEGSLQRLSEGRQRGPN